MAIIKISQEDINRQQKVDQGWHKFTLIGCEEKASKDRQSVNFWPEFECVESTVDARNVGRVQRICVNSKGIGFHLPMFAAMLNCSLEEIKEMELDMDKLKGTKVWIEIKDKVDNGNIQKDCVNFAPGNANVPF